MHTIKKIEKVRWIFVAKKEIYVLYVLPFRKESERESSKDVESFTGTDLERRQEPSENGRAGWEKRNEACKSEWGNLRRKERPSQCLFCLFSKNMKSCRESGTGKSQGEVSAFLKYVLSAAARSETETETYDEETGSEKHTLDLHIQVQGELDPEVVCVREGFLYVAGPLLADAAHGRRLVHRQNLKRCLAL